MRPHLKKRDCALRHYDPSHISRLCWQDNKIFRHFLQWNLGKFILKGILSCCCAILICSRLYLIREHQNPAHVYFSLCFRKRYSRKACLAGRITNRPNKGFLSWRFYCSFVYAFLFQILSPATILCSEAAVNVRHCTMNGCDLKVD
jgi:hypothetical protein